MILALYVIDLALNKSGEERQTSYEEHDMPCCLRLQSQTTITYSIRTKNSIDHNIQNMPKNFDFTDIKTLISTARLNGYRSAFDTESDAETFGIYAWNLELAGALGSLLQLVEVALRNTINEAGKININTPVGEYWFDHIPSNQVEDEEALPLPNGTKPLIESIQKKNFVDGIKKAKRNAKKLLKKKLGEDTTAIPTIDQIISQTDFSVWEYIFDKCFYDGDSNSGFLWPKGYIKAFKKPPTVTGKNKQFQQRDIIRRRIEMIRSLRNRVYHNEPLWSDSGSNDITKIVSSVNKKIDEILELTYWISPSLNRFIKGSAVTHRLKIIVSENEIESYLYKNQPIEIVDIESLNRLIDDISEKDIKVIIKNNGTDSFIYCKKNRFN